MVDIWLNFELNTQMLQAEVEALGSGTLRKDELRVGREELGR